MPDSLSALYTRRDILKGLLISGVATSVMATPVSSARSFVRVTETNLLRNGSFETDGFGTTISEWTVTTEPPEVSP